MYAHEQLRPYVLIRDFVVLDIPSIFKKNFNICRLSVNSMKSRFAMRTCVCYLEIIVGDKE